MTRYFFRAAECIGDISIQVRTDFCYLYKAHTGPYPKLKCYIDGIQAACSTPSQGFLDMVINGRTFELTMSLEAEGYPLMWEYAGDYVRIFMLRDDPPMNFENDNVTELSLYRFGIELKRCGCMYMEDVATLMWIAIDSLTLEDLRFFGQSCFVPAFFESVQLTPSCDEWGRRGRGGYAFVYLAPGETCEQPSFARMSCPSGEWTPVTVWITLRQATIENCSDQGDIITCGGQSFTQDEAARTLLDDKTFEMNIIYLGRALENHHSGAMTTHEIACDAGVTIRADCYLELISASYSPSPGQAVEGVIRMRLWAIDEAGTIRWWPKTYGLASFDGEVCQPRVGQPPGGNGIPNTPPKKHANPDQGPAGDCVNPGNLGIFVIDMTDPTQTSADNSTVVSDDGVAPIGGTERITVTLYDQRNRAQVGHTVSLVANPDPGDVTITIIQAITDADGIALFDVSSSVAQDVTVEATDDTHGVTVTDTEQVTFS